MSPPVRLHPDDIEAVAQRIVELLRETPRSAGDPIHDDHAGRLLTAGEAAELLGVSERYVWRLGREGALPRVKAPGRKYVRFPRAGVLAYRDATFASTTPRARVDQATDRAAPFQAARPRSRRRF
jgi:excisionase family DNA binding protein